MHLVSSTPQPGARSGKAPAANQPAQVNKAFLNGGICKSCRYRVTQQHEFRCFDCRECGNYIVSDSPMTILRFMSFDPSSLSKILSCPYRSVKYAFTTTWTRTGCKQSNCCSSMEPGRRVLCWALAVLKRSYRCCQTRRETAVTIKELPCSKMIVTRRPRRACSGQRTSREARRRRRVTMPLSGRELTISIASTAGAERR